MKGLHRVADSIRIIDPFIIIILLTIYTTVSSFILGDNILNPISSGTSLSCQLLGMNCATPTDFTFSFKGFLQRGGETDIHRDGWGVLIYEGEGSGIRQFHDSSPASTSPMANFLSSHPIRTLNMMSHIRYATVGGVELSNVHPFSREMWGINWAFSMNGDIPMFKNDRSAKLEVLEPNNSPCKDERYYHPIGSTDSEAAFCAILNALRVQFQHLPSLPVLQEVLQKLCNEIIDEDPDGTIMNFMLTCGPNTLWVYSWPGSRPGSDVWNGLYYTTREHPFTDNCQLSDIDYSVDFASTNKEDNCVSVIATKPLTKNEEWVEMSRGELIVFDQGRAHISPKSLFDIEMLGHGLHSSVFERPVLEDDMKEFDLDPELFQGNCI
mmetsp:Transcript_23693/g.23944  ORF Transcript_23693/g.23944 Transcript_23693/m.23944 type:complete len:381 (+) Transcript_23693:92-1234(+)